MPGSLLFFKPPSQGKQGFTGLPTSNDLFCLQKEYWISSLLCLSPWTRHSVKSKSAFVSRFYHCLNTPHVTIASCLLTSVCVHMHMCNHMTPRSTGSSSVTLHLTEVSSLTELRDPLCWPTGPPSPRNALVLTSKV